MISPWWHEISSGTILRKKDVNVAKPLCKRIILLHVEYECRIFVIAGYGQDFFYSNRSFSKVELTFWRILRNKVVLIVNHTDFLFNVWLHERKKFAPVT